jgi:hypothetical protein
VLIHDENYSLKIKLVGGGGQSYEQTLIKTSPHELDAVVTRL